MIKCKRLFLFFVLIFTPIAFAESPDILTEVPKEKVCMVNDTYMTKEQIPVPFQGKTYYGCCEMCVSKLKEDIQARNAVDPLNGAIVDKATAYIVMKSDKKVLYFSSKDTFAQYSKRHPESRQ